MKKIYTILFLFFFIASHAQDPHFSQAQSVPLLINPAFAGSLACGRADVGYRLQWPKLSGSYETFNASYDQYFKCGGVGFNYMHDNEGKGTLLTDRFDFDYAPYIALFKDSTGKGKIIIQPGIDVCYYQKKLDFSKLNFGDMIDPRRGFVYSIMEPVPSTLAKSNIDFSTGLLIYTKHLSAGFAVFHLSEPDDGFIGPSPLRRRYVAHAAAEINCFGLMIIPSVLFMQQQDFRELVLNLNAKVKVFSIGVGFRNYDAVIFSAGYEHWNFHFNYSYDLTVSGLAGTTGGAHELHIGYRFLQNKWKDKKTNLRLLN